MKKFSFILMICILSFMLVVCGCEKNDKKDTNKDKQQTQIEKTINDLYTDDRKLVYDNNGLYKLVYYYQDNVITGVEHYYEYKDEKEAKEHYEKDKEELKNDASIKKISLSGKYVVYVMTGDRDEGKTVEEIKNSHSYLLPVYEN